MKVPIALLLLAAALWGCAIRWGGQEKLGVDPDVDLWIHHPQQGLTNAPSP